MWNSIRPLPPLARALVLLVLTIVGVPAEPEEGFEEVVRRTEEIRGLQFKQPVSFSRLEKPELAALLEREMDRLISEEEWRSIEDSLVLLGAAPKGISLRDLYRGLLGEQVAGLYDPHAKQMHVVGNLSLKVALTQIVLEHELTHALTDQHFDLLRLPIERTDHDDRSLAAMAVVEGDATLSMVEYAKDLGADSLMVTALVSLMMDQESLSVSPPLLQAMFLFPYLGGEVFLINLSMKYAVREGRLVEREDIPGGTVNWEVVNHLYLHPPESTEQILHPEKCALGNDPPVEFSFKDAKPFEFDTGWEYISENTFGEFLIKTLLMEEISSHQSEEAAAGWGGDRYTLARGPNGEQALFWRTIWDTEEDAAEFRAALEKFSARDGFGGPSFVLPDGGESGREVSLWVVSEKAVAERIKGGMLKP